MARNSYLKIKSQNKLHHNSQSREITKEKFSDYKKLIKTKKVTIIPHSTKHSEHPIITSPNTHNIAWYQRINFLEWCVAKSGAEDNATVKESIARNNNRK